MSRQPVYNLRRAKSINLMRAIGCNKPQVWWFLLKREEVIKNMFFASCRLFNTDVMGVSCICVYSKALTVRGWKEVGNQSHMRCDVPRCDSVLYEWHWAVYSAPLHFPKTEFNQWFMLNALSGAVVLVQQNVWVRCDIFLAEQKVSGHVHSSMDSRVLLSLHDCSSPKDLQIIRSARVTKSVYSALHYKQLINYILRNFNETVQRRRRTPKRCRHAWEAS
jgi:hypothetical protein